MKILDNLKTWIEAIKTARSNKKKTELEIKIEEAEQKHRETGKRYHVLPTSSNKLVVVDNTVIDIYNKKAKNKGMKKITIVDLLKMANYSTK